jgi:hypothetical protein
MTELPADQCGHCLGLKAPEEESARPAPTPATPGQFRTGSPSMLAEYHGTCPGCGEHIEPGDTVKRDAAGIWNHEECA